MRMCEYQERALVEQTESTLRTHLFPIVSAARRPHPITIGVQVDQVDPSSGKSETQRLYCTLRENKE